MIVVATFSTFGASTQLFRCLPGPPQSMPQRTGPSADSADLRRLDPILTGELAQHLSDAAVEFLDDRLDFLGIV